MMGLSGDDPEGRVVTQSDVLAVAGRERRLNFFPGAQFRYENTSYALMATLVQRVSGRSLAQFADERIFGPLRMTSTHIHQDHTDIIADRALGYEPMGRGYRFLGPLSDEVGDGGVWTTVEDLAKWDANFYTPKVGGPQAIALLQTPGRLNDGMQTPYALGLFVQDYHGLRMISHGGVDPGYRAQMLRFAQIDGSLFASSRTTPISMSKLWREMRPIFIWAPPDPRR